MSGICSLASLLEWHAGFRIWADPGWDRGMSEVSWCGRSIPHWSQDRLGACCVWGSSGHFNIIPRPWIGPHVASPTAIPPVFPPPSLQCYSCLPPRRVSCIPLRSCFCIFSQNVSFKRLWMFLLGSLNYCTLNETFPQRQKCFFLTSLSTFSVPTLRPVRHWSANKPSFRL